jgi:hypothetical protein
VRLQNAESLRQLLIAVTDMCEVRNEYLSDGSSFTPLDVVELEGFDVFPEVKINGDNIIKCDVVAWNDDFTRIVLSHYPYPSVRFYVYFGLDINEDEQDESLEADIISSHIALSVRDTIINNLLKS